MGPNQVVRRLQRYACVPYCQRTAKGTDALGRSRTPSGPEFEGMPAQRLSANVREPDTWVVDASTDQKVAGSNPAERAPLTSWFTFTLP